jgi:hypothetical protein
MRDMEHDDAVAGARAHLAAKDGPPLGPLPGGFDATRTSMHGVAENLLKPKRELETGNEIALQFTPGGFGSPPWETGVASGVGGQVRVEGVELVSIEGPEEHRRPLDDVSLEAAAALADWFAFGTIVLADLLERHRELDPTPIRLWPEHFDVATELGSESAGGRANYGASPGDADHPEPYIYVGPWNQSVMGEVWNASGFTGAELSYADLLASDDQLSEAAGFLALRLSALATVS